jgi:enediyne biosynthesis protein E4
MAVQKAISNDHFIQGLWMTGPAIMSEAKAEFQLLMRSSVLDCALYPMTNNPLDKGKNSIELNLNSTRVANGPRPPTSSIRRAAWSLVVGFLIVLCVAGLFWINHKRAATRTAIGTPAPSADQAMLKEIPNARFTDVTIPAGIHFVHNNGAYGEKLLPETTGGGCAFFDFDNDGYQDILFVNSTYWPWKVPEGKAPTTLALYRNDGMGHFQDVTAGSGLDVSLYGMGVAVGDYDNDGWVDVFITAVGANHLYRNLGNGKFADVTAQAGIGGSTNQWSTSCAWFDYDNDGKLDLFVCNYVRWSHEIDLEVNYQLPGIGRAYGPPMNFVGTFPYLYHNDGQGHFTDVSSSSGIQIKKAGTDLPMAKSLGVAPVDFDGDGWIDLIVANDTVQNFAFHNERNGTFKEVGAIKGLAYSSFGGVRGAMGIDSSRVQDDDNLAVAIGNYANEMTALYVTQRDPFVFTDEAIKQGIGPVSLDRLTFGVFFFDYDLDGWLDLLTTNGHIEPQISTLHPSQHYQQPAQLFWNARGTGRVNAFIPVPAERCGPDIFTPIAGRGSAYADIDGDGDLDVLMTQIGGPPLLLRNDQKLNHHWLRLKLVGTKCNRDAIGAWVKVRIGGRSLSRQVMPTRGFLSQSELPVTFGLGTADRVDDITVTWPDGSAQHLGNVRIDALTVAEQSR